MGFFLRELACRIVEMIWGNLPVAAERGDAATVDRLLSLGAEPNQVIVRFGRPGETALYLAARYGHAEVVGLLLNAGADPNLPNGDIFQHTPLHAAVEYGHDPIARFLVHSGADINARTKPGKKRPLDYCKSPLLVPMLTPPPAKPAMKAAEEKPEEAQDANLPKIHAEAQATRRRMTKHIQPAPRL